MKHYKIFEHPAGNIEAVKLGWSWPAFFFGFLWALAKKMWCWAVVFLPHSSFAESFDASADEALDGLITVAALVLAFLFGLNGNRWRENNLQSRGYDYKETQTAANPDGATALYLKQKSNAPVQPGVGRL